MYTRCKATYFSIVFVFTPAFVERMSLTSLISLIIYSLVKEQRFQDKIVPNIPLAYPFIR